jgi:thymidylate synthase
MHLYEALWMLSGRNDVAPLTYYAKQFAEYSDDGKTFNGAYGYRWRQATGSVVEDYDRTIAKEYGDGEVPTIIIEQHDQLKILIEHLKKKPDSRRAVLQMWNCEDDLLKIDSSKDVCCNTNVYFLISSSSGGVKFLDMTVCNRSNDLIWGVLGANVVHFSFLQEYMAACIGVEVGVYNQFTNNLHVYTENNSGFHPDKWLAEKFEDYTTQGWEGNYHYVPLVRDPVMFDREVVEFV